MDIKKESVKQWGYSCVSDEEINVLVWPVRFKPGVTLALVLVGLLFRQPYILMATGFLGLFGTLFQKLSWIDALYNGVVRHGFGAPEMPSDPTLRRLACGMADSFVLAAGALQLYGLFVWAWVAGGLVALLSGSVVATGICLPVYLIHKAQEKKP